MATDGETPLADFDGLRKRHVRTRAQLAIAEAENIRGAVIRYLLGVPSRKVATFDFGWMLRLHGEMFGDVWSWAGQIRDRPLSRVAVKQSRPAARRSKAVKPPARRRAKKTSGTNTPAEKKPSP